MRNTLLDGARLRDLRMEAGLTQSRLAEAADVSERTLRYAEGGKPIRRDVAHAIARALSVPLTAIEVVAEREHSECEEWQRLRRIAEDSVREYVASGNAESIFGIFHPRVVFVSRGTPPQPYNGVYEGIEAVREYFRRSDAFCATMLDRTVTFERAFDEGQVVVISAIDRYRTSQSGPASVWATLLFLFEGDRIIRFEQSVGELTDVLEKRA